MDTSRRGFLSTAAAGFAGILPPPAPVLGCATLPYRGQPLARALEGIHRTGYRHILPYAIHQQQEVFTPALTAPQRAALRRRFADAGVEPNLAFAGLGLKAADPGTLDIFLAELDLAAEFAIPTVVGIGPSYFTKFPNIPKRAADWLRECGLFYPMLERAVRRAESLGVTIALKPHTGITATARACMEVIRIIPSENLKICWDAGNVSFYEGIGPDPDLPELVPHLRAVCLKDHRGLRGNADFPVPGTGQVDHPGMFRILFAGGYRGPFYVERIDGMEDAARMQPELIDQRLQQAREIIAPMLESTVREVIR